MQANTFASVYLENQGKQGFALHELPMEAQWSSINDMLIEDFDQDGNLDLLVAGNLYAAEVETPRNDAGIGLVLLGDGKGAFDPLSKAESGFFAPYDVKSLARINKTTVLVGSNNGPVLQFSWEQRWTK